MSRGAELTTHMFSEARAMTKISRAAIALIGVAVWFVTQSLLASRGFPNGIGDGLHVFLSPLTEWLAHHDSAANILLIATSAVIDFLGCYLLFAGVMGSTVRPLLGLFLLFALRQLCQGLIALPAPPNMIWREPGVPALLVTYQTGNDFFFSGHTAIAVYGAMELCRYQRPWLKFAAVLIAAIEALTVLTLRAHYTMDVFTAILAAWWVSSIAVRLAPFCDRWLVSSFLTSSTALDWRK
jgi:PAP2 superfamily C-terminal